MTPRIVLTASRGEAVEEYLDALREAGADPVRVEAGDPVRQLLKESAGVVVTGGVDVDPASYHAEASEFITETESERDVLEIDVVRAARELRLPTLCICRGLQIANVAFGGTLIADIPHHLAERSTIRHRSRNADGRAVRGLIDEHVVAIDPESALAGIVGTTRLTTGARHHQSVDRCSSDLRAVGRTGDGIIEALEARFATPYWLAVQWHPESTRHLDNGASRAIFDSFTSAAASRLGRSGQPIQ